MAENKNPNTQQQTQNVPNTKIMQCSCSDKSQDTMYGKGNRVFNTCRKSGKVTGHRCTVCGRTVNS